MIDDDECGVVGGMRIGRGNRSTRRKPAPVPLCSPQIPHDLTWARTRAAAVGSLSYGTANLCKYVLQLRIYCRFTRQTRENTAYIPVAGFPFPRLFIHLIRIYVPQGVSSYYMLKL
jgi:hypothetical protein